MKKQDIIKLIEETVEEMRSFYGVHDTYGASPRQTRNLSGYPGVMEDEDLKEFTDYGQEGRYPKKEKPGDMFQQKEVEELLPIGMASRSDKSLKDRLKKHADWTEQSAYNNTFVHMQYHETKGLEDEYFIYQTQHYNGNYDDFRNPKFTLLSITKNKDTENEENLGEYIVDTNAYVKDLKTLKSRGVIGDRVMELFGMKSKPTQLPIAAERIKKVFNAVNNSSRPEFFKNVFKGRYGIPFPENLENITKEQAIRMNMFMNDMKNNIREIGHLVTTKGGDTRYMDIDPKVAQQMKTDAGVTGIETVTGTKIKEDDLGLTNDIGKDDYVDDEGRMAKSQLYKMAKYAVKLHRMLDDMEQLPSWLQAKITKASDYMSMVYHYLDYEFARRDGSLMEEVDKYKEEMLKELTEEPNEGNAFAVARLKAIKAGEKKFKVGNKEFDVTNVSDDDKKAAEEI